MPEPLMNSGPTRLDRELNELLQELRVIQGGILLLVGFLLVIAFSPRFTTIGTFDKVIYYLTLLDTGLGAIVVVAPVVHHRLAFRRGDKENVVVRGNLQLLIAIGLVAISIIGIITLVSSVLFGPWVALAAALATLVSVTLFWVGLPTHSLRHLPTGLEPYPGQDGRVQSR